jgi:hypothetical protein
MKIFAALLLSACLCIFGAALPAGAATATQGDFALALAQILGFDATTVDAATGMLQQRSVSPQAGWVAGEPLSLKTIADLRSSLKKAAKSGSLKPAQIDGAIDAAMAAVGMTMPTIYQADFALVLAKVIGFDVETGPEAIEALQNVGVSPKDGWKASEQMNAALARELEYSLDQAVLAGNLKDVLAANAVLATCDTLGVDCPTFEGLTQRATIIPWYAPVAGPPADPIYIEPGGGDVKEGSPYRR